jgi:5S rRNA maturation endonuclease (ribonuclease M5)
MGVSKTIQDIKQQSISNANKKAIIVEGEHDERALSIMLDKLSTRWKSDWVIAKAGKKKAVLDIIEKERSWIGVVDKDEWDAA